MDRFVPLGKQSKKAQKEFHARQRRSWNGISPVTQTVPNKKAYNRKRLKADERRSSRDFSNETTAAFLHQGTCPSGKKMLDRGCEKTLVFILRPFFVYRFHTLQAY